MSVVRSALQRVLAEASSRARIESPHARALLQELAGKRLAVAVAGTPYEHAPLVLICTGQSLGLMESAGTTTDPAGATSAADTAHTSAHSADAMISGAPLSLLALARDAEATIRRGDVQITGDAQVAQRFRELAVLLAPDLENEASRLIGRSAAHLLMGGLRSAGQAARNVARTSARNLAEYLAHENGTLVSRAEAEHFLRGVEQAREQLDRLEARVALLERSAAGMGGIQPGGAEPA